MALSKHNWIFVPRPWGYEFENPVSYAALPITYVTIDASNTPKIVLRVPQNPNIDDFGKIVFQAQRTGGSNANISIQIKNLRTSDILDTVPVTITFTSWVIYQVALAKDFDFIPGDFLEITLSRTSGGDARLRTYGKAAWFTDSAQAGLAFPAIIPGGASNNKFGSPNLFLTWKDSGDSEFVEWLPGIQPVQVRFQAGGGSADDFWGNRMLMPFDDKRPIGFWAYLTPTAGSLSSVFRVHSDPVDDFDKTVLWSFPFTFPLTGASLFFFPFDGTQPILEKGKHYVIGIDNPGANWKLDAIGPIGSTQAAVQFSMGNVSNNLRWNTTGTPQWLHDGITLLQCGLVFDGS